MDTHGTLVTVGPCILKIHHQLVKIGCWSNASLALTWHSAPHKCAKFRSSRYSTPPRVLEQSNCLKTSLPGMASLTVNLNEMIKPRRHKSVGSVRNCCNHSQSRCMPTLHKKRSKRSGRDAGSLEADLSVYHSPTVQSFTIDQKKAELLPPMLYLHWHVFTELISGLGATLQYQ